MLNVDEVSRQLEEASGCLKTSANPEVLCLLDILFTSTYINHLTHNSPVKQTDLMNLVVGNDIAATRNQETRHLGRFGNPELAIQDECSIHQHLRKALR